MEGSSISVNAITRRPRRQHHKCCQRRRPLRRGLWSPDEDDRLKRHIQIYGAGNWCRLAEVAGLERCGKSCRLRWLNYLRPDLKRGPISASEAQQILHLHGIFGSRWSVIASFLPGRSDNEIKNFLNCCTRHSKRVRKLLQTVTDKDNNNNNNNMSTCTNYTGPLVKSSTTSTSISTASTISDHRRINSPAQITDVPTTLSEYQHYISVDSSKNPAKLIPENPPPNTVNNVDQLFNSYNNQLDVDCLYPNYSNYCRNPGLVTGQPATPTGTFDIEWDCLYTFNYNHRSPSIL